MNNFVSESLLRSSSIFDPKLMSKLDVINYFPISNTHTMSSHIDQYVIQKLPIKDIKNAIIRGYKIEIHGIYPLHFNDICKKIGYEIIKEIEFYHIPHNKKYNFVRPKFFITYNKSREIVIAVSVTPGSDYIYHYSGIVRHYLNSLTPHYEEMMSIYRYPYFENNLRQWSMGKDIFVEPDEIVIIGFVDEVQEFLKRKLDMILTSFNESEYYASTKYILDKKIKLNFIGVKFSFWGNLSEKIIQIFCDEGAKEIIYIGKLGTLGSPKDLYDKIFSPSRYVIMKYDKIIKYVNNLPNNLVRLFPDFNSNLHLSVPTVMEEDMMQRKKAASIGVSSIDNEISQMASAVEIFNKLNKSSISFTCLHFATDYLKKAEENDDVVSVGLYNNREKDIIIKKKKILKKISHVLYQYLQKKYGLIESFYE